MQVFQHKRLTIGLKIGIFKRQWHLEKGAGPAQGRLFEQQNQQEKNFPGA
jgi:hypothetical protein